MNEKLLALLERFNAAVKADCADCEKLTASELKELGEGLGAYRSELLALADDKNVERIRQLGDTIAFVAKKNDELVAAYAAQFEAEEETAAVTNAAAETQTEAPGDLAEYQTKRPAGTEEAKEIVGKVLVASALDAVGNPIYTGSISTSLDLTQALMNGVEQFGGISGKIPIATGTYSNDGFEVINDGDDPGMATAKMLKALAAWEQKQADHLAADGSFCAPVTPDYSFCDLSDTAFNLFQQSVPSVRTIRGRVQYMLTPTNDEFFDQWGGVDNDTFEGVGTLFTEEDSIAVAADDEETWKKCVQVDCPEQQPAEELSAHYTCVEWKHFTWKAYPEYVDLYTRKSLAAHQLKQSLALLRRVQGIATTVGGINAVPSNVAGFFSALDVHFAAYRDAYWLRREQVIDVIFPRWVLNMLRAALARRSDDREIENLRVSDSVLSGLFASINLRPNFVTGWQRLARATTGGTPNALNSPIGPATGNNTWPASFQMLAWVPGSVVLLENPDWNIGIERIRDTVTQRQNKYGLFLEDFTGIATPCPYEVQELSVAFCPAGDGTQAGEFTCDQLVTTVEESPSA